jgi:peptidoglycan/LPS O-acetylase OafA/YrhL
LGRSSSAQNFQNSRGRIPTLDGWRGVAILLVVINHTTIALRPDNRGGLGQHGVTLFFVLSGFLITSLLLSEEENTGRIDLKGFYIRRVFRLLPCVLAYLEAIIILDWGRNPRPHTTKEILGCLFFFRNFLDTAGLHSTATGQFWSLSIEEQFYLLWPSILLFSGQKRARWISLAGAVSLAIFRLFHWQHLVSLNVEATFGTQYRADALLIGCAAALWLPTLVPLLKKWMAMPLLLTFIVGIALFDKLIPLWESTAIALLLCLTSTQSESVLGSLLEWKPLRIAGKYSYSLYIWQQILLFKPSFRNGPLVGLLLLPAVGAFSYSFIERPIRELGVKLAARRACRKQVTLARVP